MRETDASKAERSLWYTSSDRAQSWFEGQKSDLSNPFQTKSQLDVLTETHDAIEAQIRSKGESAERTRTHDFYAECIGLVSQWKAFQDRTASKKPPSQEAVDNVQQWAKGLFANIPTEGKTAQQLMAEQTSISKGGAVINGSAIDSFHQMMAEAKHQTEMANSRKEKDPTAQWDLDYWSSYQNELLTMKDFLVDQSDKQSAYMRTKGPTEEEKKIIEDSTHYVDNVLPKEVEKQRLAEEERKAQIAADLARMRQESADRIDAMGDPGSDSTFLWIAVGIAAAGVLGMAVFL